MFTSRRARPDALPQSAQVDALSSLSVIYRRKYELQIERELLIADRKAAVKAHRSLTSLDERLRAVTAELLRIG